MLRLVFITHGSTGDIVPIIRLAESAVRRGHQATLLASHHWKNTIESRGIDFIAIPPKGSREELSRLMKSYSAIRNPMRLLEAMYRHIDEWQAEILPLLDKALENANALLYSYLFPLYQASANAREIPTISVHFCPNTYFSPLHPPDDLPQLPGFFPESVRRGWNNRLTTLGDQYVTKRINRFVSRNEQQLQRWLRSPADYSIVLAPPELHRGNRSDLPPETVFSGFVAGGFSSEDSTPASGVSDIPLLNFGSVTTGSMADEFRSLYQTWPADQPLTIQKGWFTPPPPPDQSRIQIISPCPHEIIFPQASVIIHHGGAGTTTSALLAGRPQIIIPHFADQPFWGRTVTDLGCGISLRQKGWGKHLWNQVMKILHTPGCAKSARDFAKSQVQRNGTEQALVAIESWLKA